MAQSPHGKSRRMASLCLVLISTLTMCACSQESAAPSIKIDSSVTELSLDTSGEMIPIQSDNVSMAGYDTATQRMTVMFDNGKAYWYQPVDQSVWTAFYNAQPHPWSQVGYP